jgi:kynurenine formamidase
MRIVDLSVPIGTGTQVFPGDPVPAFAAASTIETEGYNVLHVAFGTHTGTHVDAPYHVRGDGARVDELPVNLFLAPAIVVDLRDRSPRSAIDRSDLAAAGWRSGVAAVLHTGWSDHRGTPRYFDHPYLTPDAARLLLESGVRTIALDTPNPDLTDLAGTGRPRLPVHRLVADVGGILVENLTAVDEIDFADPWLSVLPLRIVGADGAPCRAVAFTNPG